MAGTLVCRRLLPRLGIVNTYRLGTGLSLTAGVLFLTAVVAGIAHWSLMLAAMFLTMGAHGVNFPIAQSGAVSPFPKQAGTAAGLMGALFMTVAFAVGTIVGATHNGTLYPLAIIVCVLSALVFASMRATSPIYTKHSNADA
jgi:DHA1 family bicyclomycin/chloramphenicol resistance-like MFS transporter